jgi:dolichol-phosphate mannosyltransferase
MFGYSNKPLRFISFVGILVALLSFIYGAKVALNAILNEVSIPGFSAIASLLSFLTGLTLLMLGIIGEYLWRIYEEVNRRPVATIDAIIEK